MKKIYILLSTGLIAFGCFGMQSDSTLSSVKPLVTEKTLKEMLGFGKNEENFDRKSMVSDQNKRAEGYWQDEAILDEYDLLGEGLPTPVPYIQPWKFQTEFLKILHFIEKLIEKNVITGASVGTFRGLSPSRFEKNVGVSHREFQLGSKKWPEAFRPYYLGSFNVKPSQEFYLQVLGWYQTFVKDLDPSSNPESSYVKAAQDAVDEILSEKNVPVNKSSIIDSIGSSNIAFLESCRTNHFESKQIRETAQHWLKKIYGKNQEITKCYSNISSAKKLEIVLSKALKLIESVSFIFTKEDEVEQAKQGLKEIEDQLNEVIINKQTKGTFGPVTLLSCALENYFRSVESKLSQDYQLDVMKILFSKGAQIDDLAKKILQETRSSYYNPLRKQLKEAIPQLKDVIGNTDEQKSSFDKMTSIGIENTSIFSGKNLEKKLQPMQLSPEAMFSKAMTLIKGVDAILTKEYEVKQAKQGLKEIEDQLNEVIINKQTKGTFGPVTLLSCALEQYFRSVESKLSQNYQLDVMKTLFSKGAKIGSIEQQLIKDKTAKLYMPLRQQLKEAIPQFKSAISE